MLDMFLDSQEGSRPKIIQNDTQIATPCLVEIRFKLFLNFQYIFYRSFRSCFVLERMNEVTYPSACHIWFRLLFGQIVAAVLHFYRYFIEVCYQDMSISLD